MPAICLVPNVPLGIHISDSQQQAATQILFINLNQNFLQEFLNLMIQTVQM